MAKIFFIRHAESAANAAGIYQGQTHDTNLSPLGQKQVRALSARFAGEKLDRVYTSPLVRTRRTAAGLAHAPIDEPALLETNHGLWEGKSRTEIITAWPELYSLWLEKPSRVRFPGGENFGDILERTLGWLTSLADSSLTVAAVTHSNVIMALVAHLRGQSQDDIWRYVMQPTAVTLIETHSPAKIIYINDISHLADLQSDLATHAI